MLPVSVRAGTQSISMYFLLVTGYGWGHQGQGWIQFDCRSCAIHWAWSAYQCCEGLQGLTCITTVFVWMCTGGECERELYMMLMRVIYRMVKQYMKPNR